MITKDIIDQFYKDVDNLGLKRPGATIAAKTEYSPGNVSEFLSRKREPSPKFLKKFYEVFEIVPPAPRTFFKNVDAGKELGYLNEVAIRHEASLNVVIAHIADILAQSKKTGGAKELRELQKMIDDECDRIFDVQARQRARDGKAG